MEIEELAGRADEDVITLAGIDELAGTLLLKRFDGAAKELTAGLLLAGSEA